MIALITKDTIDLDNDDGKYLFQTFRIDLHTTFGDLKKISINLWNTNETELKYMIIDDNNEFQDLNNCDNEVIDIFLKNRSNMNKARFILISDNMSIFILLRKD